MEDSTSLRVPASHIGSDDTTAKGSSVANDIQDFVTDTRDMKKTIAGIAHANAFAMLIRLLTLSDNPGAATWP